MKLQVYLNFEGQSEDAVNFYAKALNAPEPKVLKFGALPPNPEFPLDEKFKDFVMHTEVDLPNIKIQISDIIPPMKINKGDNVSIVLACESLEEITAAYNNLSVDCQSCTMPLGETMWAEKYAYFVDKFGTPWQLNFLGNKKFGQ